MPIPQAYGPVAARVGHHIRVLLYIGLGGFAVLFAVVAMAAALNSRLPAAVYEILRLGAHAIAVAWLLLVLEFFFHPTWGVINKMRRSPARAVRSIGWLFGWFAALVLDFGLAGIVLSLLLT